MSATRHGAVNDSRRRFLQQAGVAAAGSMFSAGAMADVAQSASWAGAGPVRQLHLGLLVPDSPHFAANRLRLEQGLRLGLATRTLDGALADVTLVRVPASLGGAGAVRAYEELAREQRVHAVVGFISVGAAAMHRQAVRELGVPLVVVNAGTDVVRGYETAAGIHHASFDQWHAEMALGNWSAHGVGRRGALLISPYEGGYDAPFAFQRGLASAGGEAQQWVGRIMDRQTDIAAMLRDVAATRPEFVYAAYAGPQAAEFVAAWERSPLAGRVPLLVSGFMANEAALLASPVAQGVRAAACWAPALDTPANRAFTASFQRQYGAAPDAFAALGYDAALLLAQRDLAQARFAALGGEAQMEPAKGMLRRAPWLLSLTSGALRVDAPLAAVTSPTLAVLDQGPRTGFITPYLCA